MVNDLLKECGYCLFALAVVLSGGYGFGNWVRKEKERAKQTRHKFWQWVNDNKNA